jgi:hypothetical protein
MERHIATTPLWAPKIPHPGHRLFLEILSKNGFQSLPGQYARQLAIKAVTMPADSNALRY